MLTHNGSLLFTCPYCSRSLDLFSTRERHITLQPYCHARRERELNGYISAHMKKKARRDSRTEAAVDSCSAPSSKRSRDDIVGEGEVGGDSGDGNGEMDEPLAKRIRGENANPAGLESTSPPVQTSAGEPLCAESFPIPTAGAPVSNEIKATFANEDLRDYLASCGRMGEPKKFEIAELMMTTKLDGKGRTRHLKSNLVSGLTHNLKTLLTVFLIRQTGKICGKITGNC